MNQLLFQDQAAQTLKDRRVAELQKLCVSRREAAAMLDLSVAVFDRSVEAGLLPTPIRIGRRKIWAIKALERAIDRLAGLNRDDDGEAMEALKKWRETKEKIRATSSAGK